MDPALQQQLADLLHKLAAATENAATWTAAQAGPLIQEKIMLGRVEHTVQLVLIVAGLSYVGRGFRYCQRQNWDVEAHSEIIPLSIFGAVAVAFLAAALLAAGHGFLAVWFAPRLYILEWLRDMLAKP
jgi:hypothetical protein